MKYVPPINGDINDPDRGYINADPATGQEGSIPPAAALEHVQREVVALIEAAGLAPNPADLTQAAQAVQALIALALSTLDLLTDLAGPNVSGILPINRGGTGATTPAGARAALFAAAADHGHAQADIAGLAAALAALVPITRTITAGTGLTGGGDLTTNRTLALAYATQAQAEAGTDTTAAMTSLRTAQAIAALAPRVVAGATLVQNPFTTNAVVTQAHGLGAVPDVWAWRLVCLTPDLGWSAGDVYSAEGMSSPNGNGILGVELTAANVVLRTSNSSFTVVNKTTRGIDTATPARWRLEIMPYKVI